MAKIGVNPEVEVPFKIPEILICEKSYFGNDENVKSNLNYSNKHLRLLNEFYFPALKAKLEHYVYLLSPSFEYIPKWCKTHWSLAVQLNLLPCLVNKKCTCN